MNIFIRIRRIKQIMCERICSNIRICIMYKEVMFKNISYLNIFDMVISISNFHNYVKT